jgi:hypothetical protein
MFPPQQLHWIFDDKRGATKLDIICDLCKRDISNEEQIEYIASMRICLNCWAEDY